MRKRKTSVYCLLLLAVLILTGAVLSVGETQARYINTVVWNTYVEPMADEAEAVTFTPADSLTVLLGEMDGNTDSVQFYVQSPSGATGSLTWSEDAELEIRMQQGDAVLNRNDSLTLPAETPVKLVMILTDQGQPREAKTVEVAVTWTEIPQEGETEEAPETLTATFRVELAAVEEPTEPPTEAPSTEEPTEEPTEAVSEPATEPAAPPAGEEDQEPVAEETSEPSTEETTAPAEEEPSEEEPTEPPLAKLELEALSCFDPAQVLPFWISAENGATVRLGFGTYADAASAAEMQPFPVNTRFSLDGGQSWFLLYRKDTVSLDLSGETQLVLLDLSGAALATGSPLTLMAEGWSETTQPAQATATVTPLLQTCTMESRIMAKYKPLQLTLTEHWPISTEETPTDYSVTYSVERLVVTGSADEGYGKEYEPVELPAENAGVEEQTGTMLAADRTGQTLTIRTGSTLPPPGTYRLSLNWTYREICIGQTQVTFFINYLNDSDSAQTGGAEQ